MAKRYFFEITGRFDVVAASEEEAREIMDDLGDFDYEQPVLVNVKTERKAK